VAKNFPDSARAPMATLGQLNKFDGVCSSEFTEKNAGIFVSVQPAEQ
jgi:hypothetical protein